jgi:hypothetical protein
MLVEVKKLRVFRSEWERGVPYPSRAVIGPADALLARHINATRRSSTTYPSRQTVPSFEEKVLQSTNGRGLQPQS